MTPLPVAQLLRVIIEILARDKGGTTSKPDVEMCKRGSEKKGERESRILNANERIGTFSKEIITRGFSFCLSKKEIINFKKSRCRVKLETSITKFYDARIVE